MVVERVRAGGEGGVGGGGAGWAVESAGRRRTLLETKTERGHLLLDPATAESIWCEVVVE